jgi:hypothetical protein
MSCKHQICRGAVEGPIPGPNSSEQSAGVIGDWLTWISYLQSAFSTRLSRFDFNSYPMLVVDLMHEFEQGVWKNLFTHLLRILQASDPALVIELDRRCDTLIILNICPKPPNSYSRYRLVPRFGRDGIRKFSANSSEMKKMAARDFEDLLQVSLRLSMSDEFQFIEDISSVRFLFSMVFSPAPMTKLFKNFCLHVHTGTHWPSSGCIPIIC